MSDAEKGGAYFREDTVLEVWDVFWVSIWTEQPDDVADVLISTEFVAIIVAKAVLEAVILDELLSESSDDSLKSATGSSCELNSEEHGE